MAKRRQTESETTSEEVRAVEFSVPVAEPRENGYQSRQYMFDQLHVHSMTLRQRKAMQRMYAGLRRDNKEIGIRPIASQADAVRWLLEQVADGLGLEYEE